MSEPLDQNGPGRARFLQVFLAQRARMESLVSRRVGCRATAADLVQELFLRFWRRPQIEVEALDTYLLRCAGNIAIDHLRSENARERATDGLCGSAFVSPGSEPQAALEIDNDLRRINAALCALPERTQQIFLLNRLHGRTYAEIATSMGVSPSAVEKHMMRALEACKASIADGAHGRWRPRLGGLALSASLMLAVALAAGVHPRNWLDDFGADYVAAVGEVKTVTLADQSQLTLDADSAISVDFAHGQRQVEIRRGAVFFQVSHTGAPFVVKANGGEVRVLGTQFEVRRQGDGAQVTVLSGKVGVSAAAGEAQQLLGAGQQVAFAHGSAEPLRSVDSESQLAWRQGWLSYYQVPLAQVVEDLARHYPGRIVLLGSELGERNVSGSFPADDPLAALDALGSVAGFKRITVLGRVTLLR
ncbi:hypothetical protein DCO48_02410 [Pseudomonas sp. SDI]|uniref:sigma-70 family RNA polymerase sigma factor n=1 Tax=Pseudomonas sp. SDI TaxID=2170734 RepID=UPI000DE70732|nr:sigma-70 family RNA polymerase sigma factor [Pseudomonas sp. SDI]PWB35298.1 hypothetical protein DCO48_02410 [Pseudomonas sp. SDI]